MRMRTSVTIVEAWRFVGGGTREQVKRDQLNGDQTVSDRLQGTSSCR
ncbi:hypothetical protein Hamer_G007824, partial [Homarus americanus]